jgi:hypothetical protein
MSSHNFSRDQTQAKSWRDVLPIHPAAELFPMMSPDELRALGDDIKANGLRSPIAITCKYVRGRWEYALTDGRSRLDGMEAVGIPFKLALRDGHCIIKNAPYPADASYRTDAVLIHDAIVVTGDPYAYVISANIHRRHLTAEQKRDLIAKLLKATPEKSNRQIAETVKASHHTVSAVRTEMEGRGQIAHVETHTDTNGREQPAHKPPPAHIAAAIERAEETSAESAKQAERIQAVGNAVDPDRPDLRENPAPSAGKSRKREARADSYDPFGPWIYSMQDATREDKARAINALLTRLGITTQDLIDAAQRTAPPPSCNAPHRERRI